MIHIVSQVFWIHDLLLLLLLLTWHQASNDLSNLPSTIFNYDQGMQGPDHLG